jgi:hypothetical protein
LFYLKIHVFLREIVIEISALLRKINKKIIKPLTLCLKFDNLEKVSTGEGITQRKKLGKREGRRF